MPQGSRFVREVEEIADHDVDEDTEIVGVKVFIGCRCGEEEEEKLKDEELEAGFIWKLVSNVIIPHIKEILTHPPY